MTWGVLQDDLGVLQDDLGGYYRKTWGGVYKITWGILQNDLGGITR